MIYCAEELISTYSFFLKAQLSAEFRFEIGKKVNPKSGKNFVAYYLEKEDHDHAE